MDQLMEYALQIAATLLVTLIGVLGTWLSLKLGKSAGLQNIDAAQKELIRAARITVDELQQTLVTEFKAANEDGKLSPEEIARLKDTLLSKTLEKLSLPALSLLKGAAVDVNNLIAGVGEAWIERMKSQTPNSISA
ncbi:MAG: hypothetical protein LLF75_03365 [Eubacteriales bacterium]|nr:hypothetical protein [Eubacteriales bacterium]